jgi:hypothetical protein
MLSREVRKGAEIGGTAVTAGYGTIQLIYYRVVAPKARGRMSI